MIKLAIGFAAGYLVGTRLGEAGLDDILAILQQTLENEQVAELVRTSAAIAGEAIRTLGVIVTEEGSARLSERMARRQLSAA
jgi:hypothetical protein